MVTWAVCQGAVPVTGKGRAFSSCAVCCNCPGDRRRLRQRSIRDPPQENLSQPLGQHAREKFLQGQFSALCVEFRQHAICLLPAPFRQQIHGNGQFAAVLGGKPGQLKDADAG